MKEHNNIADERTTEKVYNALQSVIDPEIGINIVDLGLIYGITLLGERLEVTMTLTTPACPMGSQLIEEAREAVTTAVSTSLEVNIRLNWKPEWDPEMMSDKAKHLLGWK